MDKPRRARVVSALSSTAMAALIAVAILGVLSVFGSASVLASQPPPDSACIGCHGDRTDVITLPSGEELSLGIDLHALDQSVHGIHADESVYCSDCHHDRNRYRFPHQPNPAETLADFSAEVSQNCQRCHEPIELHNPGHLMAESADGLPTCTDCHGGHEVEPTDSFAADPVSYCQSCHSEFEDPVVGQVHADLVANFGPEDSCQSCHNDQHVFPADAQCKQCHSMLDSEMTLLSGDAIPLNVDMDVLEASVHGIHQVDAYGYSQLLCTDCHKDQERYQFPHDTPVITNLRSMHFESEGMCYDCHTDIYDRGRDGVHADAYASGISDAATCTDCHGNHDIQMPAEPRQRVSETCAQCHSTIAEQYTHSVHGAALLGEDDPDVPVCTDCHGVHDMDDPSTAEFRVSSPQMCGDCHADEEMMARHDISTEVFDTYVADFHGTTVDLFARQSPYEETNKAVCYDCHGIHNILPANDENSQIIQENLLETCRQCHPDATANFTASWTSHYQPSLQHNPLVYLINLFYQIVIPFTIGGILIVIGTDVFRMGRERRRRKPQPDGSVDESAEGSEEAPDDDAKENTEESHE